MSKVAIIGGGISGLAAAYSLEKARHAGAAIEWTLFEASPRLGGVLQTEHIDNYVIEAGADSFLSAKKWARDFCEELGLGEQLIYSRDLERKTWVFVCGRLVPIPDGMQFMVPTNASAVMASRLFSIATKLRFMQEWMTPQNFKRRAQSEDESVEQFVARHFGHEVVDRLAEPMLAGIYGGDASAMSVRTVLPAMVKMEQEHGSLVRAALAGKRTQSGQTKTPIFTSLRGGMGSLANTVAQKLSLQSVRCNSPVQSLRMLDYGWQVISRERADRFDEIVLALPAYSAAQILRGTSASADRLAEKLTRVNYTSSVAVALGFRKKELQRGGFTLPSGFGFLVPRSEGKRMLACTFVGNKFDYRAPEGGVLLRTFFGGKRNQDLLAVADEELVQLARAELKAILKLEAEPELTRVNRWSRAMAQYDVGHRNLLDEIAELRLQVPNLHLCGNAYQGIGVPDCIRSGQNAAQELLKSAHRPVSSTRNS
jgi:oxygen-dependent protoporphyrinogen oxidase